MRCGVRNHIRGGDTEAQGFCLLRGALLLLTIALMLSLTACSFGDSSDQGQNPPPSSSAAIEDDHKPTAMDSFRALAPPEGLKFTQLFSAPVKNTDERIKRLENAVQSLRNDFDTVVPSMVRLVAIEKDIRELLSQLQTLNEQPGAAPTTPVERQPVDSSIPPMFPPPVQPKADGAASAPPLLPEKQSEQAIPGEDVAGGTEPAKTASQDAAKAGTPTKSSLVTPEAASKGELPPEGAASPFSKPGQGAEQMPPPMFPAKPVVNEPPAETKPPVDAKPQTLSPPPPAAVTPRLPVQQGAAPETKPAKASAQPSVKEDVETAAPAADEMAQEPAEPVSRKASTGTIDVKNVRIADHADKTRIVLDVVQKADFKAVIGGNGKSLTITAPQLNLNMIKDFEADSAALISGYHANGDRLIFDLMYPSDIKAQQMLLPSGSANYRIVIDLFSKDAHKK